MPTENVRLVHCSQEGCESTHAADRWSTIRADSQGWFHQMDRTSWCPLHVPDWVPEWREKQRQKRGPLINYDDYEVTRPDWSIPVDVIAIEHHVPGLHTRCLVASSTPPHTITEVLEAIKRHHEECNARPEQSTTPPPAGTVRKGSDEQRSDS